MDLEMINQHIESNWCIYQEFPINPSTSGYIYHLITFALLTPKARAGFCHIKACQPSIVQWQKGGSCWHTNEGPILYLKQKWMDF